MSLTRPLKLGGLVQREAEHPSRRSTAIGLVMLSNLVFNLTDLATSSVAMSSGLAEGNPLVLAVSAGLGGNVLVSLVVMKLAFVAAAAAVALVGIRSASGTAKNLAFVYLLASTAIFYIASLNNVFWIVATSALV